jgi:hypothetical protein
MCLVSLRRQRLDFPRCLGTCSPSVGSHVEYYKCFHSFLVSFLLYLSWRSCATFSCNSFFFSTAHIHCLISHCPIGTLSRVPWQIAVDCGFDRWVYWTLLTVTLGYNTPHVELLLNTESLTVVCVLHFCLLDSPLTSLCLFVHECTLFRNGLAYRRGDTESNR